MPIGVICNSLAILTGGIFGVAAGQKLSDELKSKLNMVFGCCAMGMGISSIPLMTYMPAVILSMILGTVIGVLIHLDGWFRKGGALMQKPIAGLMKNSGFDTGSPEYMNTLITVIVLFCASGTGIYGTMVSGMTGDHTILISKSILDFFTAAIFACNLGAVVSMITVPQFIIFMVLFAASKLIFPLTTPDMINDFKACGGFILVATGLRIAKIKDFPVADMIPAMILVMPVSWAWCNWVLPLL